MLVSDPDTAVLVLVPVPVPVPVLVVAPVVDGRSVIVVRGPVAVGDVVPVLVVVVGVIVPPVAVAQAAVISVMRVKEGHKVVLSDV